MAAVVYEAWHNGLPIQSDAARLEAQSVCIAAELGLITTFNGSQFTRTWRATARGITFMEEL